MLVDFMNFGRNSWLIPNELQMELENRESCIPSIVYAYFLQFLCNYHLNNVKQCQNCLHTLQLVIAEHYLMVKDTSLQSGAYNILGIASHLSGDREAASLAFMQSLEIYPHHRYNSSIEKHFVNELILICVHKFNDLTESKMNLFSLAPFL